MYARVRGVVAPRWDAGRNLTIMAVCFGLTVVLTRLYLISTGYPKIGGGVYHIAHALFGGLALVVACVLMLLRADSRAVIWCAVLSGIGLGLFIDEVGKFITANNDYFFPLAAPIIYLAFLAVVLAARRAGRMRARGARAQLSEILDGMQLLVGGRLTPAGRQTLLARLDAVSNNEPDRTRSPDTEFRGLATTLLSYLRDQVTPVDGQLSTDSPPSAPAGTLLRLEARLLPRSVARVLLIALLAAHSIWSITRVALTAAVIGGWGTSFGDAATLLDPAHVHGWKGAVTWGCATAAEVVTALLYLSATVGWLRGHERSALRTAITATVLTLTAVNVLNSYFHQFATVFTAVAEGVLLLALLRYRARFLPDVRVTDPQTHGY
jgi:hypothetical protein